MCSMSPRIQNGGSLPNRMHLYNPNLDSDSMYIRLMSATFPGDNQALCYMAIMYSRVLQLSQGPGEHSRLSNETYG